MNIYFENTMMFRCLNTLRKYGISTPRDYCGREFYTAPKGIFTCYFDGWLSSSTREWKSSFPSREPKWLYFQSMFFWVWLFVEIDWIVDILKVTIEKKSFRNSPWNFTFHLFILSLERFRQKFIISIPQKSFRLE